MPANDETCRLIETLVERRKVVHEEKTATTLGTNAVAVAPMTKEEANQGSPPPEIHRGAENQ
jgi:hypothetical protein